MKFYGYPSATPLGSEDFGTRVGIKAKTIEEAIQKSREIFHEGVFSLYSYRDALRTNTYTLITRQRGKQKEFR